VIRLSIVAGGKWGHAPRGVGLGGASTYFIQTFKKCVFQQKFGPKCLKMSIIENIKITAAPGDPPPKKPTGLQWLGTPPQDPALLLSLIDINLSKCVLAF